MYMMLRSGSRGWFRPGRVSSVGYPGRSKNGPLKIPGAETMLRRPSERGSTSIAFALAAFIIAMTIVTVYIFWAKIWWFPPAITNIGHEIDDQFGRTLLITGVVFVAAQFGLAYALFRFRDQGQKATYFEGNNTLEVVWTL